MRLTVVEEVATPQRQAPPGGRAAFVHRAVPAPCGEVAERVVELATSFHAAHSC